MKIKQVTIVTFYDKILIISILIIAVVSYGLIAVNIRKSPDSVAVVRQNGVVVLKLTQEKMEKDGIYDFKFDGGTGFIEVKDSKVRMLPMNKSICPKAVCSETGWIDASPKTIVCMPNRLVVSFTKRENINVDGIVF